MPEERDDPVFLSWGEYWAIAVRRRWWILLPLFLGWAAVWGVSWLLPSTYQSDSLILVEQQKVPDQYVEPNVTGDLQERLQSVTEQILSRTRLQSTIDRLGLYSSKANPLRPGDSVERMRRDIKIELVSAPDHPGDYTAFKVSYTAGSAELARKVNEELTSLFIEDNVKARQQISDNTTAFFENELDGARTNMEDQEARVAAFEAKHLGELPSQLESNVQILAGLQAQEQSAQQALDSARQQKLYLESLLEQYQAVQASAGVGESPVTSAQTLDKQLLDLQVRLQDLQSRYTEQYPDILALKNTIAKTEGLKKQSETAMTAGAKARDAVRTVDPASVAEAQRGSATLMMQVQSQLKADQLQIANLQQHQTDIESRISAYQARLNLAPETEQELAAVSRGYEESKSNYDSLLQKQTQSELATSLEHQQGEKFRVLDPPSLPAKPAGPNHAWFSLGGLILGGFLALGVTLLTETADVRVRKEEDLTGITTGRLVVGIPHLSVPGEARSRLLRRWAEAGTLVILVGGMAAGNLYAFYKG